MNKTCTMVHSKIMPAVIVLFFRAARSTSVSALLPIRFPPLIWDCPPSPLNLAHIIYTPQAKYWNRLYVCTNLCNLEMYKFVCSCPRCNKFVQCGYVQICIIWKCTNLYDLPKYTNLYDWRCTNLYSHLRCLY